MQTPFTNYAFYNNSDTDTTISENKSELQTWTLSGFDETYFSNLASDGSGGIAYIGLGDLESSSRISTQSLSVSQTSTDTSPVIQEVKGFSESEIAYYAGKTLTFEVMGKIQLR